MRRAWAAVVLLSACARTKASICEPFCSDPCVVLNGDVTYECGACEGVQYKCKPGAIGFDTWQERSKSKKVQAQGGAPQQRDENELPPELDPAPYCKTNRCNRVREKLLKRYQA